MPGKIGLFKGYIDGVGKHIPGLFSTQELLEHNWEAPAKSYIDSVRVELIGGNGDMSLSAYKAGYNEGLKKKRVERRHRIITISLLFLD